MRIDEFKAAFFNKKVDKRKLVAGLKFNEDDLSKLKRYISRLEREIPGISSLIKQRQLGINYLPKTYSDLNKPTESFTGSLINEINWTILAVSRCADQVNLFLKKRREFENCLVSGSYDLARIALSSIENDICKSFWTIENTLILDEFQHGSEKNWETRSAILNEAETSLVVVATDFGSKKAEGKFSIFQYNDTIEDWENIQANSVYGLTDQIQEYIRFKHHYFSIPSYKYFESFLSYDNDASIIDRYICLIKVLQHVVVQKILQPEVIYSILFELNSFVEDKMVKNLLAINEFNLKYSVSEVGEPVIDIIDLYSSGDYESAIVKSLEFLRETDATSIEVIEILNKSIIELKREEIKITDGASIVNRINQIYFDILSKKNNSDDRLAELLKLAHVFNSSSLGIKLFSFAGNELGWDIQKDYYFLCALNSDFINPRLLSSLMDDESSSASFVQYLSSYFPNSLTVNLFLEFQSNHLSNGILSDFVGAPQLKSEIYKLRNLMLRNSFEPAIDGYVALMKLDLSVISEFEVATNLYYSYLRTASYRSCIILYVNVFMKNAQLTRKMDTDEVLKCVISGKFKNIGAKHDLIELPIFFKIHSDERIRVKQAYEMFLRENGCYRPSQLFDISSNFDRDKLILFLWTVCVSEIMQLSKYIESTYLVNAERIAICQFLAEFDVANLKFYNSEIAVITQKNAISRVIGRIDLGKIFVNEDKLKALILNNRKSKITPHDETSILNEEAFERYVSLKNFLKANEYKDVNTIIVVDDGKIFTDGGHPGFLSTDFDDVLYYPAFRMFRSMFILLRDYFISDNEFGLDAYLSTRIRHGTLTNHIRSVFERLNLVTAQSDGVYVSNEHWPERLIIGISQIDQIQALLSNFSQQVDEISSNLKENLIQCRTEKRTDKSHALFDYTYTEADLVPIYLRLFREIENYRDFVDTCFSVFWLKTEDCLNLIRKELNSGIKEQFLDSINTLEHGLETIVGRTSVPELFGSINLGRTEIQTLLSNVAEWFRRSESRFDGEYPLKMLAETSIQITKNIHPNFRFSLKTEIDENIIIRGEHHQFFIDIINICLINMIKHSGLASNDLFAELNISRSFDVLTLSFINQVSEAVDVHELNEKLSNVASNWLNSDKNVSLEGGTGFPKIKKTLQFDLNRRSSAFYFDITERVLSINLQFETSDLLV